MSKLARIRKMQRWIAVMAVPCLAMVTSGCGGDGAPSAGNAGAVESADTTPTGSGETRGAYVLPDPDLDTALAELPPVVVMPEVRQHLQAYAASCQFDLDGGSMNRCPPEVTNAFEDWVKANKSPEIFESLAELALVDESTEVRIAARTQLDSLRSKVQYSWLDGAANDATALRSLAILRDASSSAAAGRAAKAAVQLAWATGHGDLLQKALHEHPNPTALEASVDQMIKFGRLPAFRFLKWETEQNDNLVRKTLSAVVTAGDLSAEEQDEICPWAETHLGAEDSYRALDAAKALLECGPDSIPTLLADGERRLASGGIDSVTVNIYREPCFQHSDDPETYHCDAVYAFLEQIGRTESLDSDVRATALWNIYYQRRTEETATLLDGYADHPDPTIREKVQSAIQSIRR